MKAIVVAIVVGCAPAPRVTQKPAPPPDLAKAPNTSATPSPSSAAVPAPKHRLAVALLVDRSASMGGAGLSAARAAVARAASLLGDRDLLEVVVFDAQAKVVVELGPPDAAAASKALAAVKTGKGTDFYDAIDVAHADLASTSASRRHVLLVTDGASANPGLASAVSAMRDDGVGLSAFGIGALVDAAALADLAKRGGGRFVAIADASKLEEAIAEEIALLLAS